MLCKKVVNFFSLLSHTHEDGERRLGITQELLSLVTGLAHYLKILIRIALTAALKLDRDYATKETLTDFLCPLDLLCQTTDLNMTDVNYGAMPETAERLANAATRSYGYHSLAFYGGLSQGQSDALTDLCDACRLTIEDECIRLGTSQRWHMACLTCRVCRRRPTKEVSSRGSDDVAGSCIPINSLYCDVLTTGSPSSTRRPWPEHIVCTACIPTIPHKNQQFEYVSRLEQYSFLLCVALNKLHRLLRQKGVMPIAEGECTRKSRCSLSRTDATSSVYTRR